MSLPVFLLGMILATLYGAAFHVWRGGSGWRLLVFVLLSLSGFWLGHLIATTFAWNFVQVGTLQVGSATGGSLFFLLAGNWLGQIQGKGRT